MLVHLKECEDECMQSFPENKKTLSSQALKFAGILVGLGVFVYGVLGLWERYQVTNDFESVVLSPEIVTVSTDEPDESFVDSECFVDDLSAEIPIQIQIPSLEIDGCVQQVGIDQYGAIAVPSNIHLAGWFVDSVIPGNEGVSIIDGHVQGRYRDAIFADLSQISVGEEVIITSNDGTSQTFEVLEAASHLTEEAEEVLLSQRDDSPQQLTLITCSGRLGVNDVFEERFIVKAQLVN